MVILSAKRDQAPPLSPVAKYWVFASLILTTIISSLLLAGNVRKWNLSKDIYDFIVGNRATTQLIVQVCANGLGFLHVTIICLLINYATRLRLASVAVSLDTLRFWTYLLSQHWNWELPLHFSIALLAFLGLCIVPSALWAGAITPISVIAFEQQTIPLPSYSNTTLLNQNWTDRSNLPSVRNSKGFFTYNVGEEFLGDLLASAASATTIDGSVRQHAKSDFSRYTYSGRSYGAGASVGLTDDNIILDPLVTQYSFQEAGYAPMVTCIYNTSSAYSIDPTALSPFVYAASGLLPNSNPGQQEWSRYTGYSTDTIVAIGVATDPEEIGRMIGIAAGSDYATLNDTQCTIDFQPAQFNVTVDTINRNITVTPVKGVANTTNIEPSGMLTFLTTWQLTLISTDQTSLYSSLVGNSINASVNNYITAVANGNGDPPTIAEATLAGMSNSVSAMIDDILTDYASAQLMVANDTQAATASVGFQALQLGQQEYIIGITIFNGIIIMLVLAEAVRTRGWKGLVDFDYMDPRNLIIASSRGGEGIAVAADYKRAWGKTAQKRGKSVAHQIGRIRVRHKGSHLVSAELENWMKAAERNSDASIGTLDPDPDEQRQRLAHSLTI